MSPAVPPTADSADAVRRIRRHDDRRPEIALVLGSGLGPLAETLEEARSWTAADLPGYPVSTVEGHRGELVLGRLEGRTVLVVRGRVHAYEGGSLRAVAFPIRLAHALGAGRLIVTNAAGGIDPGLTPGTLMFIDDHISLGFGNPLTGPVDAGAPRFPDMSAPYDRAWTDRAERLALAEGIPTRRGVYLWTLGPSYETKAEIRFFARIGADAVGMSTVPEVIQARALGMRVLGLSTITNPAAGLEPAPLDHADVLAVGARIRDRLERLVRLVVGAE